MKHLFIVLALLLVPASTTAMMPQETWWFCMQMGTIEKSKVVVYTDIHENDVDLTIKKKEKAFTKHVLEHTKKAFYPAFDASCHEFRDPKVLSQELNKFLERAKKRGFELLKICPFRCDEGDE